MPEHEPATGHATLNGRVAVVTGASRGIGAALATGLRQAGARVFGLSRSGSAPAGIEALACDVADVAAVRAGFRAIGERTPRLSVLVNAAGQSLPPAADAAGELARFRATLDVDLTGAYACALAARPLLVGGGVIINITSINALRGFPGNPGYVAAKAGLAGLTRALAVDLAADGIRVNAIAPGYVLTAMTEASFADPARNAARTRHTLIKRWGAPEDMIGAALFLASDASRYITGQEIVVDGGWTINGLVG
jgi:NAD(P)-dependent dehydrogenase (short-subunit alcohol dehydrogenase family)